MQTTSGENCGTRMGSQRERSPLAGLRILVVDDSADNRRLVRRLLEREGAEVSCACDGLDACEQAMPGHFDLILMDLQMPVLDGLGATHKLREAGYRTPIIALTAHAMQGDRERSLRAGCDDHCTKPIECERLIDSIRKLTQAPPSNSSSRS